VAIISFPALSKEDTSTGGVSGISAADPDWASAAVPLDVGWEDEVLPEEPQPVSAMEHIHTRAINKLILLIILSLIYLLFVLGKVSTRLIIHVFPKKATTG